MTQQSLEPDKKQILGNIRILENVDACLIKLLPQQLNFFKLANNF
jgi:hypothetical protein